MSIKAERMQSAAVSTSSLEAIVREQLLMIDSKIQAHPRTFGRNIITIDLSTTFNIPGLERMEQQRYIYSNICRSLLARNFEVGMKLHENVAKLMVAFSVKFDPKEVEAMETILHQVLLVEAAQVDAFIAGTKPPPPKKVGRGPRDADPE